MNPDSLRRVGTRLVAGVAVGLMAAAALAAPVMAQEEPAYEPFLHGDITIAEAAPGSTVDVNPVFLQQQDLAADTAAVIVAFGDSVANRSAVSAAQAAEAYDNCADGADGGVVCVVTGFEGQTGTALTLTGPVGYAIDAKAPGPIDICGCGYRVTTVDDSTLAAEYGHITWDPASENLLGIAPADQAWIEPKDPVAAVTSGAVTVVTTEQQFDLYISGREDISGSIGDQPSMSLTVNNAGPATAYDMSDEDASYVFRGRMPDGVELTKVNANDSARWDCLDESELAAEYERTEQTLLDRFDFVCRFESVAAGTQYGSLSLYTKITEGSGAPGMYEVAPTYTSDYAENLDAVPWNDSFYVLNGRPSVPLARNDFNGDGLDDLMTVRTSDGALRFSAGNGDGTFDAATTVSTGWGPYDVVMAGEVNSDGFADLLVRNNQTGTLYTYPGNGSGGFKPRITSGTGWNKIGVYTSLDFDGDGMTDILAVREGDGGLYYYHGNGDGTFGNGIIVAYGYNYIDAMTTLGDVDKDGAEEVMVRLSQTQEYWVFLSTADEPVELSATLGDPDQRRFRQVTGAGDLDRDGYLDLLSLDTRSNALYRQSFTLGGTVNSYKTVQTSGWSNVILPSVALDRAHDFDQDGASDLIARRNSNDTTYIYFGTEPGGFYGNYSWGTSFSGMNLIETAGDFTGDGLPDVLARTNGGVLYTYPGSGIGDYDPGARIRIGSGWNAMSAIVSGYDYNGDGRVDIIARESSTGNLWLYPGKGTGNHGTRILIGTGWSSLSLITAVGDLDNDGVPDVLARKADNCLYVYAGKPGGGLKNGVKLGCGWNVMNTIAAVGDWNGDGHVDWIARLKSNGALYLYKGNGAGSYSSSVVIGTGWSGMDIIA